MSDCVGPALICDDGSDDADRAIRHARVLLRQTDAVVICVPNRGSRSGVAQAGERRALDAGFVSAETVEARHGPIPMAILKEARARHASVIVVGGNGRSTVQPGRLGSVPSALVHLSDIPVLVVRPRAAPALASEPIFVCYDGSAVARHAIVAAADLLAGHETIIATVIPAVDDSAVLRSTLPWPVPSATMDRLARVDREEGEGPAKRAADGITTAAAAGLTARSLAIDALDVLTSEQEEPWRRLLRAAASEDAACIVVGHRRSVTHVESTAYALIQHADRPVLVCPSPGGS